MLLLGERELSIDELVAVATKQEKVRLGDLAKGRVERARNVIERAIEEKKVIYGVTTGFGALKTKHIPSSSLVQLQSNLVRSHTVGVGNPFSEEITRAMMLIIANYLSRGYSGVRPIIIETLLAMLNGRVCPIIPQKGSVGSSGDLAPCAHLALVLIGEGEALYEDKRMNGRDAMAKAQIVPVTLAAKEGLALVNNTAAMTAVGTLAVASAKRLVDIADIAGALTSEALRATALAFDQRVDRVKPHKGQAFVAQRLRTLLAESTMLDSSRVQDQYSVRCMPQIHGAVREALTYVEQVMKTELNAVTDNPLVFADDGDVISAGNFHGEAVAIAMDTLGIALSELANVSDRRIASVLDPATNFGLPAFLAKDGGINSGLMLLQYTTASLVSENKVLAHPASVDSIPTSANVEDLVSMGTIAARKAREIASHVEYVLAIELFVACQAIDFRLKEGYQLGKGTKKAYKFVRQIVPFFETDALYSPLITALKDAIVGDATRLF